MKRVHLPRAGAAVTIGVLTAGLLAGTTTAAPAASYPTCNSVKKLDIGNNYWVMQPYYTGTGSRNCQMSVGARGDAVSQLQVAMWWCYNGLMAENQIDGIYGSQTRGAVYTLQGREGAGQDGVYGPETRKAMKWPGGLGNESGGCFRTTK